MKRPIYAKPTTYFVLALIVFLLFAVSREAKAETFVEVAPVVAYAGDINRNQFSVLLTERIIDKYDLGVILIVDSADRNKGNRGLQLLRTSSYKKFEVGIGFAYWAHESDAWSANETFALMIGRTFGERATFRLRHWSTGGTSKRNGGLDMLTFSYIF